MREPTEDELRNLIDLFTRPGEKTLGDYPDTARTTLARVKLEQETQRRNVSNVLRLSRGVSQAKPKRTL